MLQDDNTNSEMSRTNPLEKDNSRYPDYLFNKNTQNYNSLPILNQQILEGVISFLKGKTVELQGKKYHRIHTQTTESKWSHEALSPLVKIIPDNDDSYNESTNFLVSLVNGVETLNLQEKEKIDILQQYLRLVFESIQTIDHKDILRMYSKTITVIKKLQKENKQVFFISGKPDKINSSELAIHSFINKQLIHLKLQPVSEISSSNMADYPEATFIVADDWVLSGTNFRNLFYGKIKTKNLKVILAATTNEGLKEIKNFIHPECEIYYRKQISSLKEFLETKVKDFPLIQIILDNADDLFLNQNFTAFDLTKHNCIANYYTKIDSEENYYHGVKVPDNCSDLVEVLLNKTVLPPSYKYGIINYDDDCLTIAPECFSHKGNFGKITDGKPKLLKLNPETKEFNR